MRYMMLRRSSRAYEAGVPPAAAAVSALDAFLAAMEAAGVLRASESLLPSNQGVRIALSGGAAHVVEGPFPDEKEMIAGFAIIDVPSKAEALDWLRRWPAEDEGAEIELREGGCPGGCAQVKPPPDRDGRADKRFAILLRSSTALESEQPVEQGKLDRLDAANAVEAGKGVLLAADGLRTTALGSRMKVAAGRHAIVDGPFTEIKELIAGYWLIRAASMADAIAWARRNPYPTGPQVEVEIREVDERPLAFTPALRNAEHRMRALQLEAGMQMPLAARPGAWR